MQEEEVKVIGRKKHEVVGVNKKIRAKTVRLIAADGSQLGMMSISEALEVSKQDGLDLVEVSPNSDPPVCRIMDYGKFKFEARKKGQPGKKKTKSSQIKEIKFRPHTDEHDLNFKIKNLKKFLGKKNRVKVTVIFRGREMAYINIGFELLKRIADEVSDIGTVEQPPVKEGWRLTMVVFPK